MPHERRIKIELPAKPFLYTLDQVGAFLSLDVKHLNKHLWFKGIDTGRCPPHLMRAVDISHPDDKFHDWRVEEKEMLRWMRSKGISKYTRKT